MPPVDDELDDLDKPTGRTEMLKLILYGQNQQEKAVNSLRNSVATVQQSLAGLQVAVETRKEFDGRLDDDLRKKVDTISEKLDQHAAADSTRWLEFRNDVDVRLSKAMDVAEGAMKSAENLQKVVTDMQANGTSLSRKHEDYLKTGRAVLSNGKLAYVILILVALLSGASGGQIAQRALDLLSPNATASPSSQK